MISISPSNVFLTNALFARFRQKCRAVLAAKTINGLTEGGGEGWLIKVIISSIYDGLNRTNSRVC